MEFCIPLRRASFSYLNLPLLFFMKRLTM
uniref:Uncharacterized protein n=1 Tax=Lotus japonicus TaxID=34305 RepID=I3T522_LOTJA|nr:unknown [Lotus japonicus]